VTQSDGRAFTRRVSIERPTVIRKYYFALPNRASGPSFAEVLSSAGFPFRRHAANRVTRVFYDSFDWRLHRAGLLLVTEQVGGGPLGLALRSFPEELSLVTVNITEAPRFAAELPAGLMRDRAGPPLGERRLLPVAEIHSRCEDFDVLDEQAKTIARLSVGRHRVAGDHGTRDTRLHDRLELSPVKGFAGALKRLRELLENELGWDRFEESLFEEALGALGRRPSDHAAKPVAKLDPEMPAGAAARVLLRGMLEIIEANEDGVRQDLDTEFLHDLRIAVRRTRSLLGQMKGLLAAPHFEHYREEFAWLGGTTGPVRDLDVLLLRLPDYTGWLGAQDRQDLEPIRVAIRGRRAHERRMLLEVLASARYRGLKQGWKHLLETQERWIRGEAAAPVLGKVAELISDRYKTVLKHGDRLDASSPDGDFHAMRQQCKKLRYLVDAFAGLFSASDIKPMLKMLKGLQNSLGEFQDLRVHAASLQALAKALPPQAERTNRALGLLLERMDLRKRALHDEFAHAYAGFASGGNRKRFHDMFASG
jgi:CHAD domain-containing protein